MRLGGAILSRTRLARRRRSTPLAHAIPWLLSLLLMAGPGVRTPGGVPAPCVANLVGSETMPTPMRRVPPARPIAVFTLGAGALAAASGAAVLASGLEARDAAPHGDTFGEVRSRLKTGRTLVIVGATLLGAGVAALAGGIAWIVRDRQRARRALARLSAAASR